MGRFSNNPQITQFLKAHNQLVVKPGSECGTNPWEDSCDPIQPGDSDIKYVRADIPFQLINKSVWLSVTVAYSVDTGTTLFAGSTVYGNVSNISWSNYAPPAASYSNDALQISSNMHYSTSSKVINTCSIGGTGSGEIAGKAVSVNFSHKDATQTTLYQTGILFNELFVTVSKAQGKGFLQINGTGSKKYDYGLTPQR